MTCPACGQAEIDSRKRPLFRRERGIPLTLHHECPGGHWWHTLLLSVPGMEPTPCDCES
jgi:hypothetical protein